ncbi:hypothetical protein HK100_000794 [Physocladia obscura]|uniref:Uncharacterized protein n=1 Tax=Physocladia obscura TaxID=109957 RepID=A0AAD5T8K7_9FUNG|nr:hypothetical protein HK100_000794 [Physocladia obscura]
MTDLLPTEPDVSVHLSFLRFHAFLEIAFPLVHKHLARPGINKYSLLYSWKGANFDAAPLTLIVQAHIDVVPETANQWTHDPYFGYIDAENGFLWGRGSSDTKPTVIGTLEAVEALLSATNGKYRPTSDIYLAFEYLEQNLVLAGKVGVIVDEGTSFGSIEDVRMATVATGEKGWSLICPSETHTGIGYTALAIAALKSNAYPINLSDNNPVLGTTRCYVQHSKNADPLIKWAIENLNNGGRKVLATKLTERDAGTASLLTTTQSTDIIFGGLKVNALPEKVTAIINHRITVDSSLTETQEHIKGVLISVAKQYKPNLTINQFDSPNEVAFEPSNGQKSSGWDVLEGTIHHLFDGDD